MKIGSPKSDPLKIIFSELLKILNYSGPECSGNMKKQLFLISLISPDEFCKPG
jgi:hypothetical protein